MHIIEECKLNKFSFIVLLILSIFIFVIINNKNLSQSFKEYISNNNKKFIVRSFKNLFFTTLNKPIILIFEPNIYHHECIPGFSKYFIDLGYNVDIIMHYSGIDSLRLFKDIGKVRLFVFNNLIDIYLNSKQLSLIIKKYNFILVQTTDTNKFGLFKKLDLFNINYSAFVFHNINLIDSNYINFFKQNRIWTLGNFSNCNQINPHYFGDITIKNKNDKVRFFMTSTVYRNYNYLIKASCRLKTENFTFEIVITGRSRKLDINKIPNNLRDIFIFKHNVSYYEMYKLIESSDYIIIPLDPQRKKDIEYKAIKTTGSIQLVYGFLKPAIINQEFSDFYNLNEKNSLIYNNNSHFYNIMKKSILLNNNDYRILENNLYNTEKEIYNSSINNIKKVITNDK